MNGQRERGGDYNDRRGLKRGIKGFKYAPEGAFFRFGIVKINLQGNF